MSGSDGADVDVRTELPASMADVRHAVTDPAAISRWFTDCAAESPTVVLLTFAEDDGTTTRKRAVATCGPRDGDRAGFAFVLQDPGYRDSTVEVELRAVGPGRSSLRLLHRDPPAELVEGYRTGWPDYLGRLARHLAGGGSRR